MAKFNWTFSKLKNYETCGLKHQQVDLLKLYADSSDAMLWGNRVHDDIAKAIRHACALPGDSAPLPKDIASYQPWVDKVKSWLPGTIQVEKNYAIDSDMCPTDYLAPNVWHRCRADVVFIDDTGTVAIAEDWKTGNILEESVQLFCMAQVIFSHFPTVQRVGTRYGWLKFTGDDKDNPCPETKEVFNRDDMVKYWPSVLERVQQYQHAVVSDTFRPNPSGLCRKYCPVTSCGYHGKGI